jgi:hypothetical protein
MQHYFIVIAVLICSICRADDGTKHKYPNELPGCRFFATAHWRSLVPLVSTIADVRKLLGDPTKAEDIAHYSDSYRGDATADQPVFTYVLNSDWEILVYFVRSGYEQRLKFPRAMYDRLYSIDLLPRKPLPFSVKFPAAFIRNHTAAADAGWDEYSDGSGLRYEVYTSRTPYGGNQPGDLNRISYGPSDSEIARFAKP